MTDSTDLYCYEELAYEIDLFCSEELLDTDHVSIFAEDPPDTSMPFSLPPSALPMSDDSSTRTTVFIISERPAPKFFENFH